MASFAPLGLISANRFSQCRRRVFISSGIFYNPFNVLYQCAVNGAKLQYKFDKFLSWPHRMNAPTGCRSGKWPQKCTYDKQTVRYRKDGLSDEEKWLQRWQGMNELQWRIHIGRLCGRSSPSMVDSCFYSLQRTYFIDNTVYKPCNVIKIL